MPQEPAGHPLLRWQKQARQIEAAFRAAQRPSFRRERGPDGGEGDELKPLGTAGRREGGGSDPEAEAGEPRLVEGREQGCGGQPEVTGATAESRELMSGFSLLSGKSVPPRCVPLTRGILTSNLQGSHSAETPTRLPDLVLGPPARSQVRLPLWVPAPGPFLLTKRCSVQQKALCLFS